MAGLPSQCVDDNLEFLASFGALHGVTDLACEIPGFALKSLTCLSLTKLRVKLDGPSSHEPRLTHLTPEMLTSLSIQGGCFKVGLTSSLAKVHKLKHWCLMSWTA